MGKRIVTLITDFGEEDEYAGVMKGVMLTIDPSCRIIDVTHRISSQDISEAAFILSNSYRYFPQGTIHVVVVDPGVGSSRRPIVVAADGHLFVGPDNGVFTSPLQKEGDRYACEITNRKFFLSRIGATFHGRDIFSPVAAHLSLGVDPRDLGREVTDPVILHEMSPEITRKGIKGKVIHIDHFGNLITNIPHDVFASLTRGKKFTIRIGYLLVKRLSATYSDGEEGELLALFGSSDRLEFSVKNGNAGDRLKMGKGEEVEVTECEPGGCGLL